MSKQHDYYSNRLEELMYIFPPYVIEYFDSKIEHRSSITLFHYAMDYKVFFEWLMAESITDETDIKEIESDVLATLPLKTAQNFFKHISQKRYQVSSKSTLTKQIHPNTVNRMKSSLRSLFNYLSIEAEQENGEPYFHRNVMRKIIITKNKDTVNMRANTIAKQIFINDRDIEFLDYVQDHYIHSISTTQQRYFGRDRERDFAILSLFLGTGIRLNELSNLTLQDVDFTNKQISVLRKGNKQDVVAATPESMDDLKQYMDIRNERYKATNDPYEYVFITRGNGGSKPLTNRAIQSIVIKYTKSFDKSMSPHKLRHSYATNLAEQTGGDIPLVMSQLGHTSSETSILYINTTIEKARIAAKELGRRRRKDD